MPKQFREIKRGLFRLVGTDRAGYKALRRARNALIRNIWPVCSSDAEREAIQAAVLLCDTQICRLNLPREFADV